MCILYICLDLNNQCYSLILTFVPLNVPPLSTDFEGNCKNEAQVVEQETSSEDVADIDDWLVFLKGFVLYCASDQMEMKELRV